MRKDMTNQLEDLQINIIYSKRKTISIELRMDELIVRAPKGMSDMKLINFLVKSKAGLKNIWQNFRNKEVH